MRYKILILLLTLSAFSACQRDSAHLSPSKMAPILAELHIADACSTMIRDSLHPQTEKNYDSLAKWTAQIFARHNTSMKEFNQSMNWYRDRPLELDSLYASVIPILEKERKQ